MVEIIPQSYFETFDFRYLFGRDAPLEVDIGCGDGAFLLARAGSHPERNFLGVERLLGRVRRVCRHAERINASNVRVLRIESAYAVQHLLPPNSVRIFHVSFPDPWPKRRHHPRRLVNSQFLETIRTALERGGELRLTTDDGPYFALMKTLSANGTDLVVDPWTTDDSYPQTGFERKFRAQGVPIYRLRLRKV
jgi:tRNA (guanine-N7-)-methyltransferase